jgi:copper oxidase (laccase) domain-containing protein
VAIFQRLGGNPKKLWWALGPSIQRCHFEVGPEVLEAARKDVAWHDGLAQVGPHGRPHLDLHGYLRAQAHDLGLSPQKDGSLPRCTYCEPELLYSYRHGDQEGRQWGWVVIL